MGLMWKRSVQQRKTRSKSLESAIDIHNVGRRDNRDSAGPQYSVEFTGEVKNVFQVFDDLYRAHGVECIIFIGKREIEIAMITGDPVIFEFSGKKVARKDMFLQNARLFYEFFSEYR